MAGLVPCVIQLQGKRSWTTKFSSGRLSLVSPKLQQASAYYLVIDTTDGKKLKPLCNHHYFSKVFLGVIDNSGWVYF